jgi:hypothetical protein
MTYAIAVGCSHTAGVGIDPADCYVSYLQHHYQFTIENFGVPGSNCNEVLSVIVDAVQRNPAPKFIVAQWPNPVRRTTWVNGTKQLHNINSCDESFVALLKNGEENFYEPWMQSLVIANLLGRYAQIPIINIMLESLEQHYLDRLIQANIELHVDEKLPDRTWLFDSAANDKLHHSAQCHQQWASRLIGIIDELTSR